MDTEKHDRPTPRLRPMLAGDLTAVAALAATVPGEGWSRASFEREIETNGAARYLVVDDPVAGVVGFAGCWLVVDEAHVTTMAVDPAWRRDGLGRLLLYGLVDVARRSGIESLTLEVRESNAAAQGLYREFGLYETGRRPNYYRDNGEAAVIMATEPFASEPYRQRLARIRERILARWPGVVAELPEAEMEAWRQPSS